jgi:hypothetical protein
MSAVRRHRLAHMPFSDDLKLWLKADAITGVAEGAGVASWPDSSGHLYAAVQATGGLQPLLKNNVANGLAAVRFDGTDDEMALTSGFFDFGDRFTLFVVAKLDSTGGNFQGIIDVNNAVATNTRFSLFLDSTIMRWRTFGTGIADCTGSDLRNDKFALHCGFSDASATTYFLNGTQVSTGVYSGANTASASGFYLGVLTGTPAYRFSGDIAEVLIYNRALSGGERRRVGRVLSNKYALGF